jgi:hypothetical protein
LDTAEREPGFQRNNFEIRSPVVSSSLSAMN